MEIYIVREMNTTDNPTDEGEEVKRFKDWDKATQYQQELFEDGTKTYISISIVNV